MSIHSQLWNNLVILPLVESHILVFAILPLFATLPHVYNFSPFYINGKWFLPLSLCFSLCLQSFPCLQLFPFDINEKGLLPLSLCIYFRDRNYPLLLSEILKCISGKGFAITIFEIYSLVAMYSNLKFCFVTCSLRK